MSNTHQEAVAKWMHGLGFTQDDIGMWQNDGYRMVVPNDDATFFYQATQTAIDAAVGEAQKDEFETTVNLILGYPNMAVTPESAGNAIVRLLQERKKELEATHPNKEQEAN